MRILPKVSADTKAAIAAGLIRSWIGTLRFRFSLGDPQAVPHLADGPTIYIFWHEMLLVPAYTHAGAARPLISRGRDGDVIDRVVQRFGGQAIRGATDHSGKNRGGRSALRAMIRSADRGHLAIPIDGPVGPRRQARPGTVALASHTGMPIVPIGIAPTRYMLLGPRSMPVAIPLPFCRAYVVAGPAIRIAAHLDRDARHAELHRVQTALDAAQLQAERLATGAATSAFLTLGQLRALRS